MRPGTSIRTPPGDSKVKSDPNLLVGAKRKREDVAAAETSADEAMQLWQVSQTEVARRLRCHASADSLRPQVSIQLAAQQI